MSNSRIIKDYHDFIKNKPLGGLGGPIDESYMHWEVIIPGPPETPFEGGKFKIEIKLDKDYPNSRPSCKFLTKVFHPNINFKEGNICVKLLNNWTNKGSICSIIVALYGLLKDPNQDSHLNGNANDLYKRDKVRYNQLAKSFTNKFAK
jgi:ubiquitin-conjugating enzyme E2 D/E